jgi:tetrahydromethanopterin S-methyltransferase subunit B
MFIFKGTLNRHMIQTHPEIKLVKTPEKCTLECKMKDVVILHKENVIDKREKMVEKLTNKLEHLQRLHENTKEKHANVLNSNIDKRKVIEENSRLTNEVITTAELVRDLQEKNLKLEEEYLQLIYVAHQSHLLCML